MFYKKLAKRTKSLTCSCSARFDESILACLKILSLINPD